MLFRTDTATRWQCAVNVIVKRKQMFSKAIQPEKKILKLKILSQISHEIYDIILEKNIIFFNWMFVL